jgi:hypothetical protein
MGGNHCATNMRLLWSRDGVAITAQQTCGSSGAGMGWQSLRYKHAAPLEPGWVAITAQQTCGSSGADSQTESLRTRLEGHKHRSGQSFAGAQHYIHRLAVAQYLQFVRVPRRPQSHSHRFEPHYCEILSVNL